MNWRKKLLSAVSGVILLLIVLATGCGTKTLSTAQVNPIEKGEIVSVQIIKGNSYQKEFTDTSMIVEIIDHLNKVKVKKASVAKEKEVLNSGNAFRKDSTITINLLTAKGQDAQSTAILLSEKELYMPDIKSMQSKRTVSYISNIDETTLESIKSIYLLAEELEEKFPVKVLGQLNNNTAYCYVVSSHAYILKKDIPELVEILRPENWKSSGIITDEKTSRDIVINFNEFPEGKNEHNFDYNMGTLVVRQLAIQKETPFVYDGYLTKGELYLLSSDIINALQTFIDEKAVSHDVLINKMN